MRYIDLNGFEGIYKVSDKGDVCSLDRISNNGLGSDRKLKGKIIAQWNNHRGYALVTLHKNSKKVSIPVHILVAKSFIDNPENKPEVNHKDGNKLNNHYTNLEWATRLENQQHSVYVLGKHHAGEKHYNAKLTVAVVVKMRELFKTGKYSKTEIGRMFGLEKDHAINIINNKCWKTLKTA